MAHNKRRPRVQVDVVARIDGTVVNEKFTARHAAVTSPEHRDRVAVITFVDGYDAEGQVLSVLYTDCQKVTRRPVGKWGNR